jgi:aminoglycoside 6'-N-acetyltransferase I
LPGTRNLTAHENPHRPFQQSGEHFVTKIKQAQLTDQHELATMRHLLWPESSIEEHRREIVAILQTGKYGTLPMAILVSQKEDAALTGFLEVSLRSHADGCDTAHPVGFVEGWFVHETFRKQGIGRALMRSAEDWARQQGCIEIASDTWIDDEPSIDAHQALGYEIVDRCVHFRKPL